MSKTEEFRKIILRVRETGGSIKSRHAYTDEAEQKLTHELNTDMYNWERSGQFAGKTLEVVVLRGAEAKSYA
jgi:hypothetical protein